MAEQKKTGEVDFEFVMESLNKIDEELNDENTLETLIYHLQEYIKYEKKLIKLISKYNPIIKNIEKIDDSVKLLLKMDNNVLNKNDVSIKDFKPKLI